MKGYWSSTATEQAGYPALQAALDVDVAIVGAGIVGLTAAELLRREGRSVAVLEALSVGRQATGKSTAKVTSQHNLIYRRLIDDFGEDAARTYGAANEAAIRRIEGFVRELGIACGLEAKSAYVYSCSESQVGELQAEADAAARLGLPASFIREVALPFPVAGAVRFDNQAQLNPVRYLLGLAEGVSRAGSRPGQVFEQVRATEIEDGEPCRVRTEQGHTLTARDVIVATHMPTISQGLLFAKAYPFSHPMVAARIDPSRAPEGMFISTGQPSHSFRVDRSSDGGTTLVAVGGTYKTGDTEAEMAMSADLDRFLRENFAIESADYRWTNEDFGSIDGLPFIGRASGGHLYAATGFNGWGITNGTVAGMLLADLVLGRDNPWAALFDARRIKPAAGGPTFVKETFKVARHFVSGRLLERRPHGVDLAPGDAAIVEIDGEQLAVHRQDDGVLHAVSAICTHLGCVVGWNPIDRSWDCPCHGSRFACDGSVLEGPATAPLARKTLDATAGTS